MNSELRNRVVLPLVLPLVVLLGIALLVGGLALVLLFNTREVSLVIAIVVAAGIMVAFSLANSVDEQDMTVGRRSVIAAVALVPLLGGAAASLWAANGGVPAEELLWNIEPEARAPEGALVGAQNAESFCVFEDPEDESTCTDTSELTFPAQADAEEFAFIFNNLNSGVQHNFQIFGLAGSEGEPEAGETIFGVDQGAQVITGVQEITYAVDQADTALAEGDQYYYNCVIHPVMQGVLTIGPPPDGTDG